MKLNDVIRRNLQTVLDDDNKDVLDEVLRTLIEMFDTDELVEEEVLTKEQMKNIGKERVLLVYLLNSLHDVYSNMQANLK